MITSDFINKRPLLDQGQEVALISTYLTEQMILRDFSIVRLTPQNFEEVIMERNIEVVFIDSYIYETDNKWYEYKIEEILNLLKDKNVNIVIINNDEKQQYLEGDYFYINIESNQREIKISQNILSVPPLLNENLYNPINDKSKLDILYFTLGELTRNQEIQKLHVKFKPVREEIVTPHLTRAVIKKLITKIKHSSVLYIYYTDKLSKTFIKYIELIAALQNTVVVLDSQYEMKSNIAINTQDEKSNIEYVRTFYQKGIYRDKNVIKNHRQTFLNNTLIQYESLNQIILNSTNKKTINISVITSTKRKWTLEDYIKRLNNQKNVQLEVILLTHGFELTGHEEKKLKEIANFKIKFLNESTDVSFGECLNKCISYTTQEYFTKIDDDDYYYSNYLIDSWIAKQYSKADIVGKYSQFVYLESNELIIQRFEKQQYKFSEYVAGATIFCETNFIKKYMFSNLPKAVDSDLLRRVRENKGILYCIHPYEFCIFRADDKSAHTWQVDDTRLLKSAKIHFIGDPELTIEV